MVMLSYCGFYMEAHRPAIIMRCDSLRCLRTRQPHDRHARPFNITGTHAPL